MKSVKLDGHRFSLSRVSDGAGDSGPFLVPVDPETSKDGANGVIKVGHCVKCGSIIARSYSEQDWWRTSPVTKIISVNDDKTEVRFKTGNSEYVCKVI